MVHESELLCILNVRKYLSMIDRTFRRKFSRALAVLTNVLGCVIAAPLVIGVLDSATVCLD